MKDLIINVLEMVEQIKKIDLILGLGLISILLIIIIFTSKTRKLLPLVFSSALGLYRTVLFKNKYIGIAFLIVVIVSTISVFLLTESIITVVLFLGMPFKIIYSEIDRIIKDKSNGLFKSLLVIFWELEKSFLGYSITYYLVLLKLPTELKNIINYGFKEYIDGFIGGDLTIILILLIYSLILSIIIAVFIIDIKRFALIEPDILSIIRKSKYNQLRKKQVENIIIQTKYFKDIKVKSEILRVIAGFNKYEYRDFSKLLKSSVNLYYYLGINSSNKKSFFELLDKILHCSDDYSIYVNSVKEMMKGSKTNIIKLMENIEDFWEQRCLQYICYNKKKECMKQMINEIKNINA